VKVGELETVGYEDRGGGVVWVTLDRPEVHNAFDPTMEHELAAVWRHVQHDDGVRCVVLTGAGDKAFCVGIDRDAAMADDDDVPMGRRGYSTPWVYDDPGRRLGPKANDCWKPVIAAVNGMACGGAFYLLGEVDFIIAADHATFFDPHVTFHMTAAYEPVQLLQKMPLQEVLRMALLGSHERMTAQRAYEVGLVSQVVPGVELAETATWAAEAIASAPPLNVQGTLRAIWMARELPRSQALELCSLYTWVGTDPEAFAEGQATFAQGRRIDWRSR
jgi:enoyl-CoA hydratase/carnithine racemase